MWSSEASPRLSREATSLIIDPSNTIVFSVASIWEIAIKHAKGLESFDVEPIGFRRELLNNDYEELPVLGTHAAFVRNLPPLHKDPFDRLLIAQAMVEGITLLTADETIASYPGPIRKV